MTSLRTFNEQGVAAFKDWIAAGAHGGDPSHLALDDSLTTSFSAVELNPQLEFASRYGLGNYLVKLVPPSEIERVLSPEGDGMWTWICATYFRQLAAKGVRRYEHYVATRRGTAGDLLHRNAARTAFELVLLHGENAQFALMQPMHTHGQLLESLSASQSIARNKSFFAAAAMLYLSTDGKLKRGATSKPRKPKDRKPGDESGKGSIRRLPTALKRLDLTFDVERLAPQELIGLLPTEYTRWSKEGIGEGS